MHDQIHSDQGNDMEELDSDDFPSLNAQQEKPSHYTYLKEFRVDPCPLFKQHQCTNHRPYSCFYWHFANQRRRKPVRRKDGTFSYSADFYCTKYDENTGICPDGDECPYLHRVYGDVERKYHLRYYKTAPCVHPTDTKGHCSKNGAHCAFAHGSDDIRNPIFDIRELQHCGELNGETIDNRDRLNFVVEDPIWQDQAYVLINYKTEPCKKPPRLCRQGYACPYYHNGKDKRRLPHKQSGSSTNGGESKQNGVANGGNVYRSTPCPNVKKGDEWGDPDACEAGDNCSYCHTRTEQQFHPEIYKSTKCNDMLQHGYCPRGPFCAFAHSDVELQGERRHSTSSKRASFSSCNSELAAALGAKLSIQTQSAKSSHDRRETRRRLSAMGDFAMPTMEAPVRKNSLDQLTFPAVNGNEPSGTSEEKTLPSYSAVLKHRYSSGSAPSASDSSEASPPPAGSIAAGYSKAPGFEREQYSPPRPWLAQVNSSLGSPSSYELLDQMHIDACKLKSDLYLHHEIGCDLSGAAGEQNQNGHAPATPPTPSSSHRSSASPFASFPWQAYHHENGEARNTVTDEMLLPSIRESDERRVDSATNLLKLYTTSAPNGALPQRSALGTQMADYEDNCGRPMQNPQCSLAGSSLAAKGVGHRTRSASLYAAPSDFYFGSVVGEDAVNGINAAVFLNELRRTDAELSSIRCKLAAYEECAKRARQDCETWKREALENKYRAEIAEQERLKAEQDRDRANAQFAVLTNELKTLQLSGLWPLNTDYLPPTQLEQIRSRLRAELDKVERQLQQRPNGGPMCARCGRHVNDSTLAGVCPLCAPNCKSNGHHQALAT